MHFPLILMAAVNHQMMSIITAYSIYLDAVTVSVL